MSSSDGGAPPKAKRRRMTPEDREELILREATVYFAENGLSAGTIELAQRIGITQPLLYKYFSTKEALIERVYERLIPKNWDPRWELLLEDERLPLRHRLQEFYVDYATSVLTYVHVRLFLFSGLTQNDFNAQYYSVLTKRILERIARAIRTEFIPEKKARAISRAEMESVQSLHGAIYHVAYRRWVHEEQLKYELDELIRLKVDLFLDGVAQTFNHRAATSGRKKVRKKAATAAAK